MENLIESFKAGQTLNVTYNEQILEQSGFDAKTAKCETYHIEPPAKRLVIVGDLHGQLDDLLLIFKREGLPSPSNPYLINGDFVDRGDHSIEIALIIFAYQLLYPGSFHINRGNHEDRSINRVYGFMRECLAKYDVDVFDEFIEVFNWLPIVTIVNDRVCVLHGGLCRSGADLETINTVPRHLFRPARKVAAQLSTSMGGLPAVQQPGEPTKSRCIITKTRCKRTLQMMH